MPDVEIRQLGALVRRAGQRPGTAALDQPFPRDVQLTRRVTELGRLGWHVLAQAVDQVREAELVIQVELVQQRRFEQIEVRVAGTRDARCVVVPVVVLRQDLPPLRALIVRGSCARVPGRTGPDITGPNPACYRSRMFVHDTAIVESGVSLGEATRVWHHADVRSGAIIGRDCSLGKNVFVDAGVRIGDRVRIQNNVSVYTGVTLADDVFVGPSAVFTNDRHPRATDTRGRLRRPMCAGAPRSARTQRWCVLSRSGTGRW